MTHKNLICVLALVAGLILPGCATSGGSKANLDQWLTQTLKTVESLPVKQRYQKIIEAVASGTPSLPIKLRDAAQSSLNQNQPKAKQTLLLAAAPYFSQSCIPEDPTTPANKLLHICFEKQWPDGDFSGMLNHVDAASYLYARALKKEFESAGVYIDNGRRLLANLLMSNAELRQ